MYTEASGRRKNGDKARLVGPVIQHDQPVCMEFWFHMLGFHVGQLNVYVKVGKKTKFQYNTQQCVKSARIRSFSGTYSVRLRENTDQKKSEYGHFSRSANIYLIHFTTKFHFFTPLITSENLFLMISGGIRNGNLA